MNLAIWRESSYSSGGTSGECVEVARLGAVIGVRDSKAPGAGHLTLSGNTFAEFVARVKGGDGSSAGW